MSWQTAISQLRSMAPEEILSEAANIIWVNPESGSIYLRVVAELIDSTDGHLGYTQLIRICEIARHVSWRRLLSLSDDSKISDNILVSLRGDFQRPIIEGQVIEVRSRLRATRRTSFEIEIEMLDPDSNIIDATVILTLVGLSADGSPIEISERES